MDDSVSLGKSMVSATPSREEIVDLVVERVGNCYDKHDLCCSESVMCVMSQAFVCGISSRDAVRLGAGYCHGWEVPAAAAGP